MLVNLQATEYNRQMPSLWVRWQSSEGEYFEITINDVLDDALRGWDQDPCESGEEQHAERKYLVKTKCLRQLSKNLRWLPTMRIAVSACSG